MSRSAQAIIDYVEARLEELMTRRDTPGGDTGQLILERIAAAQALRAALDDELPRRD